MTSTDPVPRSRGGGSALESLLSRSVIHEKAGAVIPRDLLRFRLYGSIVCIATGLLALLFPTADSIRHGDFFPVLATPAADLQSVMHAAAIPLIVCGVALLALDPYLMQGGAPSTGAPQSWRRRPLAPSVAPSGPCSSRS